MHRDQLKPEIIWNIENRLALTNADLIRSERQRTQLCANAAGFFSHYDLRLCPTTIMPPYSVSQRYVANCNDVEFSNYIEWLVITYAISVIAYSAMSLPCEICSRSVACQSNYRLWRRLVMTGACLRVGDCLRYYWR